MHKVVFKNYRGNLMKFVNKLSVLSLIVLMFSFMNVAVAAGNCPNVTPVSACNVYRTQTTCLENYTRDRNSSTGYSSCKWVSSKCYSGGTACNQCEDEDCGQVPVDFGSAKPDKSKK